MDDHNEVVLQGDERLLQISDALVVVGVDGGDIAPEVTLVVAQLVPVGGLQRVVHAGDGVPQIAQPVADVAHPRHDQVEAEVKVRLHLTHLRLRNLILPTIEKIVFEIGWNFRLEKFFI